MVSPGSTLLSPAEARSHSTGGAARLPSTTKAAAVDRRRKKGKGSKIPFRWDIRAEAAHSFGSQTEEGVRRTAMKSTRSRNSSGRTSRSGRRNRKSATIPAAAKSPMRARRSRVLPGRKDVYQDQGDGHPHHGREDQEGDHDRHDQEIEEADPLDRRIHRRERGERP